MGFVKNFMKLLETIPAGKPILHQLEEIVHSLQRSCPSAKAKDLKQQVMNAKNQYNKEVAAMKRAYNPGPEIVTDRNAGWYKVMEKKDSLINPNPNPPTSGGGGLGGRNNIGSNGPMLGGGGLGPLWK